MALAHVATTNNTTNGGTTCAVTISTGGTNRVLVAKASVASGAAHVSTVSGGGLAWTRKTAQGGAAGGANGLYYVEIWFAFAAAQLTSQTITHSITGGNTDVAISVSEYTGGDASSAGASTQVAETTGTNVMSAAVTTQANSLLDGGFIDDQVGATHTPGTNTTEGAVYTDGAGDQYYSLRSTSAVSAGSNSLSDTVAVGTPDWVGAILEIKEAGGGAVALAGVTSGDTASIGTLSIKVALAGVACGGGSSSSRLTESIALTGAAAGTTSQRPNLTAAAFPLSVHSSGRYFVDAAGRPFQVRADTAWELPTNYTLADVRTWLDDRAARGINAVLFQITNPVSYGAADNSPWALQLGGAAGGASALPFLKNISGGTWDGDPTFAHHDADFSQPNDAYFSWVAQIIDEAAVRGILVIATPHYLGFNLGVGDGWWLTLVNASNTTTVCNTFGQYLAQGSGGSFGGFKLKTNIIWNDGVDMTPSVEAGATAAGTLRYEQIVVGMQSAGDSHPRGGHWKHDYLSTDDSRLATYMTAEHIYTHGAYPSIGPTYGRARLAYAHSPALPGYLIETTYEAGFIGQSQAVSARSDSRRFYWSAVLSSIAGATFGSDFTWIGSTAAAWAPSTSYTVGQIRRNGGTVYQVASITTGISASGGGPTGTGAGITDGGVTWNYVNGDWKSHLSSPHFLDYLQLWTSLGAFAWHRLVPSALAGNKTLITSGGGTFTTIASPGDSEVGGDDWVVSASTPDGALLLAYTPPAHTGSLTIDMTAMGGPARSRWLDPTTGAFTADATNLAATGTHAFTPPGTNASGDADWLLVLDAAPLAGISAGASVLLASLAEQIALSGSGAGVSASASRLTESIALAGTAAGVTSSAASLALAVALQGSMAGAAVPLGALGELVALQGVASGDTTSTSNLSVSGGSTPALAGFSAGCSAAFGTLTLQVSLRGVVAGSTSPQAALGLAAALQGVAAGALALSGTLTLGNFLALAGVAAGASSSSSALRLAVQLGGVAAGLTTAIGSTNQPVKLARGVVLKGQPTAFATLKGQAGFPVLPGQGDF